MNLYTYCANNPIISIDPSGHFILAAMLIGAAAGALISGSVSLYHESKSAGGISNMTADNWKNVGISAGVGGICGGIGGGFGALGASATGSLLTSSAASPLIASTATNTLGYAVGTGMAGGMAGSYTSTATQQILYGYNDPYELMQNTAVGGITGGGFGATGYGLRNFAYNNQLSSGKYQNASLTERVFKRNTNINQLKPNLEDDFFRVGPSETAISKYTSEIRYTGRISQSIEVQKLTAGGYEIVNGHHRWHSARISGLQKVPIKIKNYRN